MSKDSEKNKYSKELWEKTTVIKDMVHGYIKIPKPVVKEIIDSEQFQRLKDIEQTGMEALYPSATHKRFTHSLGAYYLAKKAFKEFRNNVKIFYPHIYKRIRTMKVLDCEQIWCRWQLLFELASLLHDCGHSPFSHTLEFIYDLAKDSDGQKVLNKKLKEGMSQGFIDDFGKETGKPHERMSALYIKIDDSYGFRNKIEVLLKSYMDAYQFYKVYDDENVLNDDIEFMMRMIIGCRYDYQRKDNYKMQLNKYPADRKEDWYIELQLRNCIIGMLNSELDVDNLDYVVRDSKFSGYANHTVDLERLLSSFTIVLAFDVKDLYVSKGIEFNQCINLRYFKGGLLNGRLTGSSHICCKNQNIKAHGRIILEEQKEKSESNQRIYKTTDEFSAKMEFNGENDEFVEISVPKGKEQSCAFIHFKGQMDGCLSGTIFVNDYKKEKKEWGNKGDLRIYFAYEQKCMSVLMSAVYNSNFEKKWIYAHHISTYTNDFLYIYLLEKYSEHILRIQKEKLRNDLDDFLDSVTYEEIDDNADKMSVDTRKLLTDYQDSIGGQSDDIEIYKVIENTNKEKLAITNNIVREFIRICIELGKYKETYTSKFYNILQKCCMSLPLHSLSEETVRKADCIFERYEEVYTAEMQIFSDILAMYDKPYVADGMFFWKTSDRDLLAAYKNLYIKILRDRSTYGEEYKEFEENYKQLVERSYLKCMWKSQPEFEYYFSDWSQKELELLHEMLGSMKAPKKYKYLVLSDYVSDYTSFGKEFWEYLKNKHGFKRFVCVPQQIRTKKFVDYEMYMKRGHSVLRLKDVGLFHYEKVEWNFFYFYYQQSEPKELDVFEILDWLKEKMQKEIEEEKV